MSGCHYPIQYGTKHSVKVNALQYLGIIGSEKARILVNSNEFFSPGDEIKITEVSVNEGKPTGNTITRYVLYIESRIPLYLDDDAIAIHLVPTRSMIETLKKS